MRTLRCLHFLDCLVPFLLFVGLGRRTKCRVLTSRAWARLSPVPAVTAPQATKRQIRFAEESALSQGEGLFVED